MAFLGALDDRRIRGGLGPSRRTLALAAVLSLLAVGCNQSSTPETSTSQAMPTTTPVPTTAVPAEQLAWTRAPIEPDSDVSSRWMLAVSAGGPGLVAVGSNDDAPGVWTSVDGAAWERATISPPDQESGQAQRELMLDVAVGGPGLVAVGFAGTPTERGDIVESDAAVWTSRDGMEWTRVDNAALRVDLEQRMESIVAGGPGLIAVGTEGSGDTMHAAAWVSSDGHEWSRALVEPPQDTDEMRLTFMSAVAIADHGVVAVGGQNPGDLPLAAVWFSPDGLTWSQLPNDDVDIQGDSQFMSGVTKGESGLVAVGFELTDDSANFTAAVWTSSDGLTWTRNDDPVFVEPGSQSMSSVASSGSGYVAVGGNHPSGAIWTSRDGVSWSRVPHDDDLFGATRTNITDVTVHDGQLVAVGAFGITRSDLAVWLGPLRAIDDGFTPP